MRLKILMSIGIIVVAILVSSCSYATTSPITWYKAQCVLNNDMMTEAWTLSTQTAISAVVVERTVFAEKNIIRVEMRNPTSSLKDGTVAFLMEKTNGLRDVIKGPYDVVSNVNTSGMEANYRFFVKGDIFGRQEMNVAWETLVLRGSTPVMPGNEVRGDYAIISQVKARSSNFAIGMERNAAQVQSKNNDAFTKCFAMHDKILVRTGDMLGRSGDIMGNTEVLKIPLKSATDTFRVQIDSITINSSPASYA